MLFRKYRNAHGGGIIVYIREHIPAKIINNTNLPNDIEGIFIELNLKNNKWLLFGTYHPPSQNSNYYFSEIGRALDLYKSNYERFILVGDFNKEDTENDIHDFMLEHDLNNIVKESTCYKSKVNPKCIDLILTNKPRSFQNTTTFDTGISDFHKMVLTSFKCKFDKRTPKEVIYRDYKQFETVIFKEEIKSAIHDINDWCIFEKRFLDILDKHAPLKKKTIRANHAPYMTKDLKKAIMKRTQLANKYQKTKSEIDYRNFRKQKNYVDRLYKREKKTFMSNLSMKELTDNKTFWRTSKKIVFR